MLLLPGSLGTYGGLQMAVLWERSRSHTIGVELDTDRLAGQNQLHYTLLDHTLLFLDHNLLLLDHTLLLLDHTLLLLDHTPSLPYHAP